MGVFNLLVSGSLLPWRWGRKQETDYETILSGLAKEIAEVQSRLTQIRTRERRASVTLTLQAFLVWALYTAVCWFFGLLTLGGSQHFGADDNDDEGHHRYNLFLVWIPVVLSPVLILFTRKIVRFWYKRVGAAEEKHLIELRRQQRDKIDEIKRATKYDHLRMLLEKYDETQPRGAKSGAPAAQGKQQPTGAKSATSTPVRQQQQPTQPPGSAQQPRAPLTPEQARMQAQQMAAMRQQGAQGAAAPIGLPRPLPPAQPLPKTWMDKVADAVLGADPSSAGPEQKYALICSRCHMHNGLALKEEFNEIQYVCPHCGQFNSRRPSSAPHSSPFSSRVMQSGGGRTSPSDKTPSSPSPKPRHPLAESSSPIKPSEGQQSEDDEDAPPPANPLGGAHSDDDDDEDGDESGPVTSIDTPSKARGGSRTLRARGKKQAEASEEKMEVDG